ncbi:MAG: DUF1292 domain-containing protein [Firmicutes bacterium]|nr:DUF1292 domain-containing protein [Bacillota bacterium]
MNNGCGCENNHDHEHNHDNCGCNHGHDHDDCGCEHEHEGYQMIYLTLDDDSELNCYVLGTFEVEEKSYIALLPEEDERVLLYEYVEVDEDEIELKNIESDDEFEIVSEAFNELFGDEEDDDKE